MPLIKYVGLAHFRELLTADFKKAGVEGQKMLTFARHEAVKVTDEVADAIHKLVGDEFEEVQDDVEAEIARDTSEQPAPADTTTVTVVAAPVPAQEDEPEATA